MDVRRYVKDLNRVMMGLAQSYGIDSGVIEKYIGLWADQADPSSWPGVEARAHAGEDRRDRRAHFALGDDARLCLQSEH